MMLKKLKSKLHGFKLTQCDLHYEGSISIDRDLMDAAGIEEFESVHVWNVSTGNRLETYVIEAPRGSKEFGLNGAAARTSAAGDTIIIATWCWLSGDEPYDPIVIIGDEDNNIKQTIKPNDK